MLGIEHSHAPLLSFTSFSLLFTSTLPLKHLVGSAWLRRSKENRNEKSHPSSKRRTRHRRRRSAPRSLKRRRRANLRADKNPRADGTAVVTTMTMVMTVMTVVVVPLAQGHPVDVCGVLFACQIWRAWSFGTGHIDTSVTRESAVVLFFFG